MPSGLLQSINYGCGFWPSEWGCKCTSVRSMVPSAEFIELHVRSGECPICMDDFDKAHQNDITKKITKEALGIVTVCCGFIMHKKCALQIEKTQHNDKCPQCRQQMKKRPNFEKN